MYYPHGPHSWAGASRSVSLIEPLEKDFEPNWKRSWFLSQSTDQVMIGVCVCVPACALTHGVVNQWLLGACVRVCVHPQPSELLLLTLTTFPLMINLDKRIFSCHTHFTSIRHTHTHTHTSVRAWIHTHTHAHYEMVYSPITQPAAVLEGSSKSVDFLLHSITSVTPPAPPLSLSPIPCSFLMPLSSILIVSSLFSSCAFKLILISPSRIWDCFVFLVFFFQRMFRFMEVFFSSSSSYKNTLFTTVVKIDMWCWKVVNESTAEFVICVIQESLNQGLLPQRIVYGSDSECLTTGAGAAVGHITSFMLRCSVFI